MTDKTDNTMNSGDGEEKLLTFPTRFPVKIMGRDESDFRDVIMTIVSQHVDDAHNPEIHERNSGKGNFVSITVTFDAQSQQQLDNLYRELSAHEKVLMAL